jgi:pimeloyl-ACP methyl ester carboxylesterase
MSNDYEHEQQQQQGDSSTSTTTTALASSDSLPNRPLVQRKYETFLWMHEGREYDINYRVEGPLDGPPLLLVHGFGANVNHFRFQFQSLPQQGYRVYAIDLLGFGASDKPGDAPYSIELFAKLVQDFLLTMNSKDPWMIAGNSIGGLTCLCVARELVSNIAGVILLNCAGGMTGFRYEDVSWLVRPVLYFVQHVVLGPAYGGRFFSNFKTRENVQSILLQQGVYGDTTVRKIYIGLSSRMTG